MYINMREFQLLLYFAFINVFNTKLNFADVIEFSWNSNVTSKCDSIGCECWDLVDIVGLFCPNVTDFDMLATRLSDGSVFPQNETYEITFTGMETLPARFLKGLIIFQLIIDDKLTSTISPEAFDGVLRLRRIYVASSSITVIPNLTQVSGLLNELTIENSLVTSLGSEVQNQPNLTLLALRNNSIHTVAADAFQGTFEVQIFDLSYNHIEWLPPDLVKGLTNLKKIALSDNRLLSVHGLLDGPSLTAAFLTNNNLTDADDILPRHNRSLIKTLLLTGNPLGKISNITFNNRLMNGRFLHIDNCNIREFDQMQYSTLNLSTLDLTGNLIDRIPEGIIDFGTNLELFFADNNISKFEGTLSHKVKRLYFSGNRLSRLGTMFRLIQVSDADMSNNLLEFILADDLRSSHQIQNLDFHNNSITYIERDTFVSLQNYLRNLDLSRNRFKSLNGSVMFLSRLKSLNVSYNEIDSIGEGEFNGLNELSQLLMQNNKIHVLGGLIHRLLRLRLINVYNNKISTISVSQLPTEQLQYLIIEKNPISCDCRLSRFLQWTRTTNATIDYPYCNNIAEVDSLKEVDNFTTSSFNLTISHACQSPCQCSCSKDVNDTFIAMTCHPWNSKRPPNIFSSNTKSGGMNPSVRVLQNVIPDLYLSDRVLTLNLENDNLTTLDYWSFPHDLKEFRLANNMFQELPKSVLRLPMLKRATLSGNLWSCKCEDVERRKWLLSKGDGIPDINKTYCASYPSQRRLAGKLLISLTDVDLCPTMVAIYVTLALSLVTVLLLMAAMTIAYNRYKIHIKVWLYHHGVTWVKEEDIDTDKIYDAFISYSNEDANLVYKDIVSVLESKVTGISLCIHDRDFVAGEPISINIVNAVKNSKRTVLILSKHFFTSTWCMEEFRIAHQQAMEDKIQRIVVIKVGDLPKELDPDIQVYLNSTTYIIWGEKHFWSKLIYVLPAPIARNTLDYRNQMMTLNRFT